MTIKRSNQIIKDLAEYYFSLKHIAAFRWSDVQFVTYQKAHHRMEGQTRIDIVGILIWSSQRWLLFRATRSPKTPANRSTLKTSRIPRCLLSNQNACRGIADPCVTGIIESRSMCIMQSNNATNDQPLVRLPKHRVVEENENSEKTSWEMEESKSMNDDKLNDEVRPDEGSSWMRRPWQHTQSWICMLSPQMVILQAHRLRMWAWSSRKILPLS